MKTIGILGGMGPLATVKLFEKIVLASHADKDQDHIPIIIDSNSKIPDRTSYIIGGGDNPIDQLVESAKRLEGAGADFLIMPCNTAHYFYDEIIKFIKIPFLNMIEETAKQIKEEWEWDYKKVGLLGTSGTYESKVYEHVFNKYDLEIITPSEEDYSHIMELIYNIKMGIDQENLDDFYRTMGKMGQKGAELFILGCTELSVAVDMYELQGNFIDPMDAITKSAILYAGGTYLEKEKTS